jgi:hypothetical protein
VVRVDEIPALAGTEATWLLLNVDEVAALSVAAEALLGKGMAPFGFVGSIVFHIDPQLLGPMGKLALLAVGAETLLCEVAAQGALGLRANIVHGGPELSELMSTLTLLTFSGGLALDIEGKVDWVSLKGEHLKLTHV